MIDLPIFTSSHDDIVYKDGYKHRLEQERVFIIPVHPKTDIEIEYLKLTTDGHLTIRRHYMWDGASGPTLDPIWSKRGSLVHDALYQLMREGGLGQEYKAMADLLFLAVLKHDIWSLDGWLNRAMRWPRFARMMTWYKAVDIAGASSCEAGTDKPIITSP